MSAAPRLTVCLPTYNRVALLKITLASVLAQTFEDFELIVLDNCSTDGTAEAIRAIADPRVRYVGNDVNVGLFRNMNRGMQLAAGEYLCFLHDDDVYLPTFLEREVAMLDRHPTAGFVHAAAYQIDSSGARLNLVRSYADDRLIPGDEAFVRYLQGHNVWFPTVMARTELYRRSAGFDPAFLCADFLMWLRLSLWADVAYIAEPLADIRQHPASTTSSLTAKRWSDEFFAILELGFRLAQSERPALVASRDRLTGTAVAAQGKRFFVSALAAVAAGDTSGAAGYLDVLRDLQRRGLSRRYAVAIRALSNPAGQWLLSHARQYRRARRVSGLAAGDAWTAEMPTSP